MKTVLETIQGGAEYLEKGGVEGARLNMELMVAHVLGCSRMQLYVDFDRPLGEDVLGRLREMVKRRRGGEPLQHVIGEVEFYGRDFRCDGRALVPRPETEELVEKVLARVAGGGGGGEVLDMGCGSGVIGVTLALELVATDGWGTVVLADVDAGALALAGENVERHAAGGRVELVESDLFEGLGERTFGLVVANLPYVAEAEVAAAEPEVRRDPARALVGGNGRGTEVMLRFLGAVDGALGAGGLLAMEIGAGQGEELAAAIARAGWGGRVGLENDVSGNERFLFVEKQGG